MHLRRYRDKNKPGTLLILLHSDTPAIPSTLVSQRPDKRTLDIYCEPRTCMRQWGLPFRTLMVHPRIANHYNVRWLPRGEDRLAASSTC
jgi:hypothetical protein